MNVYHVKLNKCRYVGSIIVCPLKPRKLIIVKNEQRSYKNNTSKKLKMKNFWC